MSKPKKQRVGRPSKSRWSPEEKLRLLSESLALDDSEIGVFLRKEGLHEADLLKMREEALLGLTPKVIQRGKSPSEKQIASLKRELSRKEKALAEAAALLVLQKKFRALMEAEGDDTNEDSGEKL